MRIKSNLVPWLGMYMVPQDLRFNMRLRELAEHFSSHRTTIPATEYKNLHTRLSVSGMDAMDSNND